MPDAARLSEAKQKLFELYRLGDLRSRLPAPRADLERKAGGPAPLSLVQEPLWRRDQVVAPLAPLYNESITIHREGPLNVAALEQSLTEVIRRHEIWRTTFDVVNGQPVQIVHGKPAILRLPLIDLRDLPKAERDAQALRVATVDAKSAFDLKQGPLVRVKLVRLDDQAYRLFLTMHQIIVDGVSVYAVLPSELTATYEAFAAGKQSPLPELSFQYADFAYCQRQWLTRERRQDQLAYWREQLSGDLPVLKWPDARPPGQTFRGAIHPFLVPRKLTEALRELGQREGATLFAVLLAGFAALLHRYTRQENIVVGTLAPGGRKHVEFQQLLGYFINPVPLRANVSGDPSFRALLGQAQRATLGAISHDDVPLEYLAEEFTANSDASRHPFFQAVISLAPAVAELPSGWDMTPMDVESGGARWDLYLELSDRANGLIGRAQYNPDLFDKAAMVDMLVDLQELLRGAVENPEHRLSALPPRWVSSKRGAARHYAQTRASHQTGLSGPYDES
jgi:Condensation domain